MDFTEEEKEYMEYLDEIGKEGIDNYGLLLCKGDPIEFSVGLQEYLDSKKEEDGNLV